MNCQLPKSLESVTFNSIEFDGIRIGDLQGHSNCGEFAPIGSVRTPSNPVEFDGIGTYAPTRQPALTP